MLNLRRTDFFLLTRLHTEIVVHAHKHLALFYFVLVISCHTLTPTIPKQSAELSTPKAIDRAACVGKIGPVPDGLKEVIDPRYYRARWAPQGKDNSVLDRFMRRRSPRLFTAFGLKRRAIRSWAAGGHFKHPAVPAKLTTTRMRSALNGALWTCSRFAPFGWGCTSSSVLGRALPAREG
jgi:hypothetical protein